jgi:hypothetical protein
METFKINGLDYECEFKLKNADGLEVEFTKSAIRGMALVDNVFEPFESGTISIANPYDFIENDTFFLRGDGRDRIRIYFKLKTDPDERKYDNTFAIIDETNHGNPVTRSSNIKTFRLIDEKAIPFMEQIPYNKKYEGKVGDLIKGLFVELLGDGYVNSGNWESGDFTLTYIPPVNWRYIDLLYHFLRIFYMKSGDIHTKAFVNYDHITKKFSFTSIAKLFQDNQKPENLLDAFAMGDLTYGGADTGNPNNPPDGGEVNKNKPDASPNIGYSTPFYTITNEFFVSRLVHGYDPILGETKIKKVDIFKLKPKWKAKFVDVFKALGGGVLPFVVLNESNKKKFVHYRLPYPIEDSVKLVEAEMTTALLFYNLQSTFSNIGDSKRTSGKFIDIYSTRGAEVFRSDEKLLGRWFVSELRHVFMGDVYRNQVMCCKTYVGPTAVNKQTSQSQSTGNPKIELYSDTVK